MRVLIISDYINRQQRYDEVKFESPDDTTLDTTDISGSDPLVYSVFDYDVSIVHITGPSYSTIGYFENLPKLLNDARVALENGRTIICLPESENFETESGRLQGMRAYEWLEELGLTTHDNAGVNIRPSQAGRSQVIQEYLSYAPVYRQIITLPDPPTAEILAVVDETDIVVGIAHPVQDGRVVVLPPPEFGDCYVDGMSRLIDVARHYYEAAMRAIPLADAPDWLDRYVIDEANEIDKTIKTLSLEKDKLDLISYSLFGSGPELENSVKAILERLDLVVNRQPSDANIDFKAHHVGLNIGFAIEVTGTRQVIRKSSKKVSQCWQHIQERSGTTEENDRLVVIANTECHLEPVSRKSECFTQNVVNLLAPQGVLLLTTPQLYQLWQDVHEGRRTAEDVVGHLYQSSGLFGFS